MESGKEREHFLALKVMRLTKPTMMVSHPVTCDQRDLPGNTLNDITAKDLATDKETPYFGLGELLTLPQNFGNIFLGETFSSYISVHNDSNQVCKEILVKADLQTSSQRLSLSSAHSEAVSELQPECSIDDIIHHEVKELGTHILVCAVSYTTQSGEKLYFRKFFKFQVLKPLDVKTKFYNSEDYVSDEVFLEAQIQNITPGPIYVESITLDPSVYYTAVELNSCGGKNSNEPVFGSVNYINPLDSRQYLYCLTPKTEMYSENKVIKGVTTIGKLDIVWRTNLGEVGRLQTSQLQRVAPGYGDIRLSVQAIPDAVEIEKPFSVTCRITNCCEREMDLLLVLQNTSKVGLLWCGISGKQLGKLPPGSSLDLPLTIIPISPGLQTISGVRLTDSFLKRTYELDEIAQIFVYNPEIE
ncbi:trafficking protein particle complex subunit 13 isoform X2 [Lingula anatina]|uniref:Trafficking protein particle complex subunit 13 isoform X1 n=1 Tax=Lingula anatina TaxID=7574 RepID=A0A1S3HUZ1_LINAN|nr:trafficking protein particle complex subunit 13 isoform X1 [Lingula anatina]XP_013389862.1 trafficking protein particle complex subunit 13 isoform X2 [Lingula anatina]|eukprot:XP_013389860.1 trafficking protein particle complex subunit 13 isoform X1 [Lingula anatina]